MTKDYKLFRLAIKFFDKYILYITLLFLAIIFYTYQKNKQKQIAHLKESLDSTTNVLRSINQHQQQNQEKIFYIQEKLDDSITIFKGNTDADRAIFGHPNLCMFSIDMTDINMSIELNKFQKRITSSTLTSFATEKIIYCQEGFKNGPPHKQLYTMTASYLKGDSIRIEYKPTEYNTPKCNVTFTGELFEQGISGNLKWQRFDMGNDSLYNYKILCSIALAK